jgi:hypothetical protein
LIISVLYINNHFTPMENLTHQLDKSAINQLLTEAFNEFSAWLEGVSAEKFIENPPQKWSIAQNLEHLIKSAKPVRALLGKTAPELEAFGKPFNAELNYDGVVNVYLEALKTPVINTTFAPNTEEYSKIEMLASFNKELGLILNNLHNWQESDLDAYSIPHPLLGNLSVRQMLYFTAYHTRHHLKTLQQRG